MMQKFAALNATGRIVAAAAAIVLLCALLLLVFGKGLVALVVGAGITVMRFLIGLLPASW
ncbi:MAG: hypothetical protein ABW199_08600 [Caulobacterales bacterium]